MGWRPGCTKAEPGDLEERDGEKAGGRGTFRGLQSEPVKSAEGVASQLLQRAQRRRGTWARLWELRRRGSSRDRAGAEDIRDAEGCPGCPGLGARAHGRPAGRWRSCRPLCSAPQLPGPQRAAPDLGPRLGPAPHAGPEPRVPLLRRPRSLTPGRRRSGAGRRPGSGISSTGYGGAQGSRRNNSPELAPWLLRAAGRGPVLTLAGPFLGGPLPPSRRSGS